jgi:putative flavoprotein involved in K+ transport
VRSTEYDGSHLCAMNTNTNHWDTIIIGGGQAGLAMGYELQLRKINFVILDAGEEVGESWNSRWDSLRLFTPDWAITYPGQNFPKVNGSFPAKKHMSDFLKAYASKFRLPVLHSMKVTKLVKKVSGFEVTASDKKFTCNQIVVATGNYSQPRTPAFAAQINGNLLQLHSAEYKNPDQLPAGDVLIVGAATSGLQIALEIARTGRVVYVSGKPPAQIPPLMLKYFRKPMIWMMNRMTIETRRGRKMRDAIKVRGQAAPLLNISLEEVLKAGAVHVSRVSGGKEGLPVLEDGNILKVSTIIWCTGFTRDFSWLGEMQNIIDDHQYPVSVRGITTHRGLYFLGMAFQYAATSTWILGIGRDASYIADHIKKSEYADTY